MSSVVLNHVELATRTTASGPQRIAIIVLNRPRSANAFDTGMISAMQTALDGVAADPTVRALILQGAGRHFCAGADLSWMADTSELTSVQVVDEAAAMQRMFETLANIAVPSIAVIRGRSYGGGVGLVACCDYAIAADNASFCLSEVRLGLLPAVILPYLRRKLPEGQLLRFALSGRTFDALEAQSFGLVQIVCAATALEATLRDEVGQLLLGSPDAQALLKRLSRSLDKEGTRDAATTVEAIATARQSPTGRAGLDAFFKKEPAPWICRVPDDVSLLSS